MLIRLMNREFIDWFATYEAYRQVIFLDHDGSKSGKPAEGDIEFARIDG